MPATALVKERKLLPRKHTANLVGHVVADRGPCPARQDEQNKRRLTGGRPQGSERDEQRFAGNRGKESVHEGEGGDHEVDPPRFSRVDDNLFNDVHV